MEEIDFKTFRKNLPKIRAVRGFRSANELSKACGFKAVKRVADFETEGRGTPTLNELFALSSILQVPMDTLLFKEIELSFK